MTWNGAKLAALREAAGLTVRELAEAIKATPHDIRRWEAAHGRGKPDGNRIGDLWLAFNRERKACGDPPLMPTDLFDEEA